MNYLEIENIDFQYEKNKKILDTFSFALNKGEILAILGDSGKGKSTILRLIAGFEKLYKGKIYLDGKDISKDKPYNRNIGYLFQDYALFPHLTVKENILFAIKEDKVRILNEMLKLIKMEGYENRYPHELSGGQKQRVALARALANKPKLLLLDEPFSSLDNSLKNNMRKEVKELLNKLEVTAIIVTHDEEDVRSIADRSMVI